MVFMQLLSIILLTDILSNNKISAEYFSTKNAIIMTGDTNSFFGVSVQLQNSKNIDENRLLIGAPKANSSHVNIETGVTYFCSVNTRECSPLIDQKVGDLDLTNSWLGAQIDAASNVAGYLMSCAPRWTMRNFEHSRRIYDRQGGLCYFIQEGNTFPIEPNVVNLSSKADFQFEDNGYNNIFGQAGFSVHYSERTSSFIVGIPGLRNWTGSVMNVFVNEGQVIEKIVNAKRTDKKVPNNAYFGYAVSSGKFTSENTEQFVAGAPRANTMIGMVYIFDIAASNDQPFLNRYEIKGTTFGEYFGAAITVADVTGDGLDDLIIGAPLYFTNKTPDIGRVYVYICKRNEEDRNKIKFAPAKILNIIDSQFYMARFGSAISSLGDINKDGFTDIVVGAPYYEGKGAIFIYLGSKQGLQENVKQVIKASDFQIKLRGFGNSFSKGVDIDDNKYNDVAVGAYLSAHVVLLKTRPRISVEMDLKSNIDVFNLNITQFNITGCLIYRGIEVPSIVNIMLTIVSPRNVILASVSHNWSKKIQFKKNNKQCETIRVNLQNEAVEYTKDITFEMKISLDKDTPGEFCSKCPIIDDKSPTSKKHTIPFVTGCVNKAYCKPNLKIFAEFALDQRTLAINSKETVAVRIFINNSGENAFKPNIVIHLQERVTLSRIPANCQETSQINCTLGRVIEANTENKDFTIWLDITKLNENDQELSVHMEVNSGGFDDDLTDNTFELNLPLYVDFVTYIKGIPTPNEVEQTQGPQMTVLTHQFDVQNIGMSSLQQVQIMILLPYLDADHLRVKHVKGYRDFVTKRLKSINNISNIPKIIGSEHEFVLVCSENQTDCTAISCIAHNLMKHDYKAIELVLEINTELLGKLGDKEIVSLYSLIKVQSRYSNATYWGKAMTKIIKPTIAASTTKWTVIGTIVGIVSLAILVLILHKLKFFKRTKYESLEQQVVVQNNDTSGRSSTRYSSKIDENNIYGEEEFGVKKQWTEVSTSTTSQSAQFSATSASVTRSSTFKSVVQ